MYGLPKMHQPNTLMLPIFSGINCTLHQIPKAITKFLIPLVGDLMTKFPKINIRDKKLASLDIKSLYTNIPINKCFNHLRNYLKNQKSNSY